jgi:hypothetical protein
MAFTNCHECGGHVSNSASKCMGCGAPIKSPGNTFLAFLLLATLAACGWFYVGGGWAKLTAKEMPRGESQVADDAVAHYRIVKQSGNAADTCVHAGMVASAYLQAKDQQNHAKWKRIERADCDSAGSPH